MDSDQPAATTTQAKIEPATAAEDAGASAQS